MKPFKIHPDTKIAHVELQVADLANIRAFYGDLMGFQLIEEKDGQARLSPTGQTPALITLTERKDARPQPAHSTGLYHTAFRFPNREKLANELLRIVAAGWPLQGASDHRVSEAIYLADPEGNGIEIYRDRPREQWPKLQETVQMGNGPLDLRKLLEEADQTTAQDGKLDPATDIGHMHLQVSDLGTTDAFYHELLGLDIVMSMPTALFMSAGGYHHHVGANIWQSRGAPRREDDLLGLGSYAFSIPDEAGWLALQERLQQSGKPLTAVERDGQIGVMVEDQYGLQVELLAPATEAIRKSLEQLAPAAI
ncbi:MAG: VOC family protein [Anaerolineales bacterium]